MYDKYNEENKKRIKILEQQICAGHTEGKIDGCQVSVALMSVAFHFFRHFLLK
jgi:hypothetical protein